MSNYPEFSPTEIAGLARKHVLTGVCCLVICIVLEVWFYHYPPRGVIGEDVIVSGSVIGNPLVDFNALWARVFNDDELMLKIIDQAGICDKKTRSERLKFLDSDIRRNLRYQDDKGTLIKITLKRPGFNDIRPFLNYFTDTLVAKLNVIGQETFKQRRERALAQYTRALERIRLLADYFVIVPLQKGLASSSKELVEVDALTTELNYYQIKSPIARLLLGEFLPTFTTAQQYFRPYFDSEMKILDIFPRASVVLSARDMPASPVQPFYELIFILVPAAMFLVYLSLLVLFNRKNITIS